MIIIRIIIVLFFVFICLFQRKIPTNTCIIYFSIKKRIDQLNVDQLKRPTKYSVSSGRVHQLITRVTVSAISIQSRLLLFPDRTDHRPPLRLLFVCLIVCFCFILLMVK